MLCHLPDEIWNDCSYYCLGMESYWIEGAMYGDIFWAYVFYFYL